MNHIDLSGILLHCDSYTSFVEEAVSFLSEEELTFGRLVCLAGSLVNKVFHFELLSTEQKQHLVLQIVQAAKEKILVDHPTKLDKLHLAIQSIESLLPSVFEAIDTASKKALVTPVKKTDSWKQVLEVFHGLSCFVCQKVEVPVAMPSKKNVAK